MWGVLAASLLFLSINRVLSLFLLALSLSIALYHGVLTLPSAAFLLLTLAVALLLKISSTEMVGRRIRIAVGAYRHCPIPALDSWF